MPGGGRTIEIRQASAEGRRQGGLGDTQKQTKHRLAEAPTSPRQLNAVAQARNNTPRKCLGRRTPVEIFPNLLLRFVGELGVSKT